MRYPPAIWKGDGVTGGTYTGLPFRIVLHTTETRGVPSYDSGKSAPHLTYNPKTRSWVQHTALDTAARALRNDPGGVETNRANALQVEIVCYSNKIISQVVVGGLWVGDLPDTAIQDLRAFVDFCITEFGVKNIWPGRQATSYSQANAPGFRMTGSAWDAWGGVLGHQHVPEQTHWDPGAFPWQKLFPPLTEDDMRVREFVEGLAFDPTRIDRLVAAGVIAAPASYWKDKLVNPDDPEWKNFVNAFEVETAIAAQQAAG